MKTRLIQIAALLMLLGGSGLASAAEVETTRQVQAGQQASAPTTAPAEERDRLAWQRVGAPESLEG